jgi:carboxyl-terminal processing protease
MRKKRIGYFSSLLFTAAAICLLPFHGRAQDQAPNALPLEELQVFSEVFGKIKSEYVDVVDDTSLLRDAIQGMLAGLDPHSTFLEPEDFEEIKISTDGKFGGLGIEVTTEDGLIKVVTPIDGTPAFDAGIHPGDLILMIDDIPVRGMSLKDAVDKMRGEPGSEIKLTVSRQGESNPLEFKLVRAIIKVQSVRGEVLEDGFGYVRLSSFQSGTAQSLRSKIKQLNEANGGILNGLVLDLRNNPGGVLTGAVEVSDLFLGQGEIVSTRGRTSTSGQSFTARPDDIIDDAPMIVLVNGGSASASEIVAGALQDHRRAIIMGTKTFGKGSVQTVIPMNNGGALKLTTARYYTPSERSIQARGIEPDIITEQMNLSAASDREKTVSESDLAGHLKNDGAEDESGSESLIQMSERISKDHQLREALNLLKGMSLVKQRSMESDG